MSLAGSDCARRWAGAKDLTFAIGSFGSEEGTLAWIKKTACRRVVRVPFQTATRDKGP